MGCDALDRVLKAADIAKVIAERRRGLVLILGREWYDEKSARIKTRLTDIMQRDGHVNPLGAALVAVKESPKPLGEVAVNMLICAAADMIAGQAKEFNQAGA